MPFIFVFLSQYITKRIDWRINLVQPFNGNGNCPDASILFLTLEDGLSCETIRPFLSVWWIECLVRRAPSAYLLSAHSPMKYEVIFVIRVSGNKIYCEFMGMNFFLLHCIIMDINDLLLLVR